MSTFLTAWALCAIAACLVITVVAVVTRARDQRPVPAPAPRVPTQRRPSAAVIVPVLDAVAFEEFLAELMITPHVEEALS